MNVIPSVMNQVEEVALWAGLLASIVSIVLSFVAIWFTIQVDKRSRDVTIQTIQSLQKIETFVERLSNDTRELIKAGWDKMLGSVDRPAAGPPEFSTKDIASGIAAELRAELGISTSKVDQPVALSSKDVERILKDFEKSLTTQLNAQVLAQRPAQAVDHAIGLLTNLTPAAQAIVRFISGQHLTFDEYKRLREGQFGAALDEVRDIGLLVPVQHEGVPAYYFPPGIGRFLRAALPLAPLPPKELAESVRAELIRIGYPSKHDPNGPAANHERH